MVFNTRVYLAVKILREDDGKICIVLSYPFSERDEVIKRVVFLINEPGRTITVVSVIETDYVIEVRDQISA